MLDLVALLFVRRIAGTLDLFLACFFQSFLHLLLFDKPLHLLLCYALHHSAVLVSASALAASSDVVHGHEREALLCQSAFALFLSSALVTLLLRQVFVFFILILRHEFVLSVQKWIRCVAHVALGLGIDALLEELGVAEQLKRLRCLEHNERVVQCASFMRPSAGSFGLELSNDGLFDLAGNRESP